MGTRDTTPPATGIGALAAILLTALLAVLVAQQVAADRADARVATKSAQLATQTFTMATPNKGERLVARCPKKTIPLGGGMSASPPPGPDGEGVYPHSYERLGVQHGWHATPVLFDSSEAFTLARLVTIQVICAKKQKRLGGMASPDSSQFVSPGQAATVDARCPKGRTLVGGGFQRTTFNAFGGSFVTESHALSKRVWRVAGQAFGKFGGDITAIAYCLRSKKPQVNEVVSAPTTILPGTNGTATTPSCPDKRTLVFGGFNSSPPGGLFFANGTLDPGNKTFSASGYNRSAALATITAHAYCIRGKV